MYFGQGYDLNLFSGALPIDSNRGTLHARSSSLVGHPSTVYAPILPKPADRHKQTLCILYEQPLNEAIRNRAFPILGFRGEIRGKCNQVNNSFLPKRENVPEQLQSRARESYCARKTKKRRFSTSTRRHPSHINPTTPSPSKPPVQANDTTNEARRKTNPRSET